MTTMIKQDEINNKAWAICDIFRSKVDPAEYKDYVLSMLFLKYISDVWRDHYDDYQKQYGDEPELIKELLNNERFVLPLEANFATLYKQRFEAGNGERIDKAFHAIEEANISKLRDVFRDISFNANKLGEEATKNALLCDLLTAFGDEKLDLRPSRVGNQDVIGNTYEYLIYKFASNSGRSAGEFYTPPQISELMAELMQPKLGDEICDPTCGSASLLMKCGKRIQAEHDGAKQYALYGQESIGSTWALAKMNMFLHGEDNHRIEWGDTIGSPRLLNSDDSLKHFDVVVANPPFSLDNWGHGKADSDKFGRFRRGLPPKTKGDYAFILHMVEVMKPKTGRMAVVAPHGVLFRGSSEGKIRQKLVEENLLDAVIGLPEKLFFGTGIPAVILILRKDKKDKNTLFIDASREFISGKNQNILSDDNIAKIVETYRARQNIEKYATLASLQDMADNDFNLNIPRYVDTFEEEAEIDLLAVYRERQSLRTELDGLEQQMENYLKELGYEF
ncbi:type I restriction-modification system subunit M [Bartonella sp. HY406]|uniref:type I restriction-modification system subunit M n=1 Tax=Bartonella sp. HY406 TaxID=2979331 RepID=UPI0021C80265|nr:type I restriction-modification system subunit M [Bartonella sp. HY406]UXN05099.1 type I restriction-modification system subunit M [Bartonella sp. HY406]